MSGVFIWCTKGKLFHFISHCRIRLNIEMSLFLGEVKVELENENELFYAYRSFIESILQNRLMREAFIVCIIEI